MYNKSSKWMQNVSRSIKHNKSGIFVTRSTWLFLPLFWFDVKNEWNRNKTLQWQANSIVNVLQHVGNKRCWRETRFLQESILSKNFQLFFLNQSILNTPSLFIAQVQMTNKIKFFQLFTIFVFLFFRSFPQLVFDTEVF